MTLLAPKVAAAKAVGSLVRAAGRGGGTSLPGKVLTRLEPHAIGLLAQRLAHGSAVISATNGKTTTAAMTAAILERTGETLVHNRAGANMAGGVASALAAAARRGGRELDGELGLFEVDEFWLAPVVEELAPRALLLANLFRDQLDRYGELEIIADRWAEVVAAHGDRSALVLNADDPLVADLGREHEPLYFGVDDDTLAYAELQHAADSKHCRRCGHPYAYEAIYLAHLGRYSLPALRRAAARAGGGGARGGAARHPLRGVHARDAGRQRPDRAAAARPLQRLQRARRGRAGPDPRRPAVRRRRRARGRGARLRPRRDRRRSGAGRCRSCSSRTPRAPTRSCARWRSRTASSSFSGSSTTARRTAATCRGSGTPTGSCSSGSVRRMTCAGTRAAELALRMKYAGADPSRLHVVEALEPALDAAVAAGTGPLYALPTYTALLELRDLLARRGDVQGHWR